MQYNSIGLALTLMLATACSDKLAPVAPEAIHPVVVTEQTVFDTDDPAIWVNKVNPAKSLIIGTDKEKGGGLYAFDMEGKIVGKYVDMARPNNVAIAYDFPYKSEKIDVAVVTERKANAVRLFKLPELTPIDGGGLQVFEGETTAEFNEPMGVALYEGGEGEAKTFYAIVGRKNGPTTDYLGQYAYAADSTGKITWTLVRKFGAYSGKKEIEAIAVDRELGYVYYADEIAGVRKYYADPTKGNQELAFFAQTDAKRDHEGISIYKKDATTGYLVVSNQQDNSLLIYPREGTSTNPHQHQLITTIPVAAIECDGLETTAQVLDPRFPKGMLVMMSNGKVFHYYDWAAIQDKIDQAQKK